MQTLLSISGLEIVMDVFIYDVLIHNMKKNITALGFHPLRSLFFKVGAKWGVMDRVEKQEEPRSY